MSPGEGENSSPTSTAKKPTVEGAFNYDLATQKRKDTRGGGPGGL